MGCGCPCVTDPASPGALGVLSLGSTLGPVPSLWDGRGDNEHTAVAVILGGGWRDALRAPL